MPRLGLSGEFACTVSVGWGGSVGGGSVGGGTGVSVGGSGVSDGTGMCVLVGAASVAVGGLSVGEG